MKKMSLLIPNHTQIPNVILDKLMYRLPDAELRVLLYICRRTYGFQRQKDQISYTQFISGIKTKEGKQLDGGCGLAREAVSKALKNLIESGIVLRIENKRGNYYEINLDVDLKEVVRLVDQFGKRTASSSATRPPVVRLGDLQKKVSKEREIASASQDAVFDLKQEIQILDESPRRDMNIIAGYLELAFSRVRDNIKSKKQLGAFIKANVRTAKELSDAGYSDDQIGEAFRSVKRKFEGKIDWKLSTVKKELTL